jgi:hypothetical protein
MILVQLLEQAEIISLNRIKFLVFTKKIKFVLWKSVSKNMRGISYFLQLKLSFFKVTSRYVSAVSFLTL